MPGRSSYKNRCSECKMYMPLCLCDEMLQLEIKTKIIVLMHHREERLPTNTARLACHALKNSEIHVRGLKNQQLDVQNLIPTQGTALLLYPSDHAIEISKAWAELLPQPLTLFVPDGSWKQARKVGTREPAFKKIQHITLPFKGISQYRLRRNHLDANLSTFEAISQALGILESTEIETKLNNLFLKMVERVLWSRGVLNLKNCKTKIPEAALLASHLAGTAKRSV